VVDVHDTTGFELWPLIDRSSDGVLLLQPDPWRVYFANATVAKSLEAAPAALIGRSVAELFDSQSCDVVSATFEAILAGERFDERIHLNMVPASNKKLAVAARLCRIVVDGTDLVGMNLRNVGADEQGSRIDPLTGLLDRSFLMARLTHLLASAAATQFALLFVDINNFKETNDRHGHLIGDRVLGEASSRLARCLRQGDRIVRYGGDEFVVLIEQLATSADIQPIIARIHQAMEQPIAMDGVAVKLSVSVGTAIGPAEFRTPEDAIAAADLAMYAAKRSV